MTAMVRELHVKTRLVLSSVLALCLLAFAALSAFAAESVGSVVAARKEAWAERRPQQEPLAGKSPVYTGDTLVTNPVGRLQVLFRDDSVLMMAPDSQAVLSEYVYGSGQKPSFHLKLAKGMTRLISGRMVEGNPGAMKVETPDFTVGIQGTRLTVAVNGPAIQVFGEQVTPDLPIIITNKKDGTVTRLVDSGKVFEYMPGGAAGGAIRPMTSVDKQSTSKIALQPSAQSMPKIESKLDAKVVALLTLGTADANTPLAVTRVSTLEQAERLKGNVPMSGPVIATISGSLQSSGMGTGAYNFNVNLGSGAISNGTMTGSIGTSMGYDLHSGTGTLAGNNFNVINFLGNISSSGTPFTTDVSGSKLEGTASNGFRNVGDNVVSGTYEIYGNTISQDTGTITGGRRVK